MTPLAGFVLAVICALIVRDARRAAALLIVPFLAVTALQTWGIAAGHGVSPPDTVWPVSGAISYYVVQAIILALALGVATMLGSVLGRRITAPDWADGARRRTSIAAAVTATLTLAFIVIVALNSSPVRHHSTEGAPPVIGLAGIGLSLLSDIVLAVMLVSGCRTRRPRSARAADAQPVRTS